MGAYLVELLVRPPLVRKPQYNRNNCTEREAEIQHGILARKEASRRDGTPDDAGRVEDLRPAASPLPSWVGHRTVQILSFGRQHRLQSDVLAEVSDSTTRCRCDDDSQFVSAPSTVPMI